MSKSDVSFIIIAKAFRVFVFGLVSIMTPIYLALLGYSPFYVGATLMVILAGNVFSNLLLTWYGDYLGRKKILLLFSFLMFLSGVLLFSTTYYPLMLLAVFIGNISTTGTEAGPFQSIETGILPMLVEEKNISRMFGIYNFIGYGASSLGALAASIPSYFHEDLIVFRLLYFVYGLVGLMLFMFYSNLNNIEVSNRSRKKLILKEMSSKARKDILKLSILFSMDAFGGGFVTQSLLSYWFYYTYHASLSNLGGIFLVANIITAFSIVGASIIAEKIGNLTTMFYSHLLSNIFLILIPLVHSFPLSVLFLFLRQSVSQMDVPTRQAFMAQIFNDNDRVVANAITNSFRSVSSIFGSPISGFLLNLGLITLPIVIGGLSKIIYDVSIFVSYRKEAK
ncbi:MAG: MFS transporter [Thermoproteota archaeon]|nr:MFS transporter [Candidatus Brockarchaeota archaeon]